jgi:hypothetical protein
MTGALGRFLKEVTLNNNCKQVTYDQAANRDVKSEPGQDGWHSRLNASTPNPLEVATLTDELDRLTAECGRDNAYTFVGVGRVRRGSSHARGSIRGP